MRLGKCKSQSHCLHVLSVGHRKCCSHKVELLVSLEPQNLLPAEFVFVFYKNSCSQRDECVDTDAQADRQMID